MHGRGKSQAAARKDKAPDLPKEDQQRTPRGAPTKEGLEEVEIEMNATSQHVSV